MFYIIYINYELKKVGVADEVFIRNNGSNSLSHTWHI